MKTLQEMIEVSKGWDSQKMDYTHPRTELRFDANARLVVPGGFDPETFETGPMAYDLTDWSLSQVCNKLGPPPLNYMRQCPPELRADNLQWWLDNSTKNDKPWMVRTYRNLARAVVSEDYSPIENTKVLTLAAEVVGDQPYELIRPWISPDKLHVKIRVADDKTGNYGIGAYIGNGEDGGTSLRITPFIQRHSCTNSIVMGTEGFEQRHAHVTSAFLFGAVKEHLGQAIRLSYERLELLVKAETQAIPDFTSVVKGLCAEHNLSEASKDLILMGAEQQMTRKGLIDGLSFAANKLENADEMVDMEMMAGAILVEKDSVFARRVTQYASAAK